MFEATHLDTKKIYTIKPTHINCLTPHNDKTLVKVQNIKGVKRQDYLIIDKTIDHICEKIRLLNGQDLGDMKFLLSDDFKRPYIQIKRESDSTTHKIFCFKCGVFHQIYHTQHCGCKIYPKFEGKIEKNKMTKQVIYLNERDIEDDLNLQYNQYGENYSLRVVKNIFFDENEVAIGEITIKGRLITVCSHDFNECKLKPIRATWFTID